MKMYMGYAAEAAHECAVLIFAGTAKKARAVSYRTIMDLTDCEFTDVRISLIKGDVPHLLAAADRQELARGVAHVVDSPPSCSNCGYWGAERVIEKNGQCVPCNEGQS